MCLIATLCLFLFAGSAPGMAQADVIVLKGATVVHERVDQYRREDHQLLNEPDLHYIPQVIRHNVLDYSLLDQMSPDEVALMKKGYRNFQWFTRTFVEKGGIVVVGPDTSSINHPSMLLGVATRREIQLLVDARKATVSGAR
ncbi:MAG: hypothetical protein V3T83_11525 [Acidobacteriota bacterium]